MNAASNWEETQREPCRMKNRIPMGNKSKLPLRGGSWGNGVGAGVFALNLNDPRANSNWNIGFRAAFLSSPDARGLRATGQSRETKGTCFPAGLNGRQKTKAS